MRWVSLVITRIRPHRIESNWENFRFHSMRFDSESLPLHVSIMSVRMFLYSTRLRNYVNRKSNWPATQNSPMEFIYKVPSTITTTFIPMRWFFSRHCFICSSAFLSSLVSEPILCASTHSLSASISNGKCCAMHLIKTHFVLPIQSGVPGIVANEFIGNLCITCNEIESFTHMTKQHNRPENQRREHRVFLPSEQRVSVYIRF